MNKLKFVELALTEVLNKEEEDVLLTFVREQETSNNKDESFKKSLNKILEITESR